MLPITPISVPVFASTAFQASAEGADPFGAWSLNGLSGNGPNGTGSSFQSAAVSALNWPGAEVTGANGPTASDGIGAANGIEGSTIGSVLPSMVDPGTYASAPFASLFSEAMQDVDQLEKQARSSVEGLISGKGVDVHEAMIATEKAEMGFELVLSVRSKALAAYQQVVGMQF